MNLKGKIVFRCAIGLLVVAGAALVHAESATQSQSERRAQPPSSSSAQPLTVGQAKPMALKPNLGVPARFAQKVLRFPVSHCMGAAEHVVVNEVKLQGVRRGQDWIGGHNGLAHGYVYCVRLPGSGACNGDASSAIVITSGGSGQAMENLFQALYDAIPVREPIDCP